MGWKFKDPQTGYEQPLNNTANPVAFLFDHTFMGIRKGGETLYSLEGQQIRVHNLKYPGPEESRAFTHDSKFVTPIVRGLTNNKRYLVGITWDTSNTNVDNLTYWELNGQSVVAHALSDGPLQGRRALVFLGHDFYVLEPEGESNGKVHVYDAIGNKIREFSLPSGMPRGITTDGHSLYVTNISTSPGPPGLWKLDVLGNLIRTYSYGLGGDSEVGRWPITYDGRYLIMNTANTPPVEPLPV